MALTALPPQFRATVAGLHRVAEQILAPARKPDNEFSLQATPGGFGTPAFDYGGERHQVRVDGTDLVDGDLRAPLTSLESARVIVADLVPASLDDEPLLIDPASAHVLADAYAFGNDVLQQLVDDAGPADEPSPVTLWPEHFDIAIELGAGDARANYGLSPGDEEHPDPYLYVGPWTAQVEGELWNATGFNGAELTWSELVAAEDPRAAALEFFGTRMDALRRMG
jgi:hypothetical protein